MPLDDPELLGQLADQLWEADPQLDPLSIEPEDLRSRLTGPLPPETRAGDRLDNETLEAVRQAWYDRYQAAVGANEESASEDD